MRIDKVEGYEWPISVACDGDDCGVTFTVTMPTDMLRLGIWRDKVVDGKLVSEKVGERIEVKCPNCGEVYTVDPKRIPPKMWKKIPYFASGDPVLGHM